MVAYEFIIPSFTETTSGHGDAKAVGTDRTVQSIARDKAWQRRFKQRARRQLRRDYDPRRVLRILSGMDHIAEEPIVISLSGTHPWDEPVVNPWQVKPRRYRAAIRKLGVG